jgi:hypothetical protein
LSFIDAEFLSYQLELILGGLKFLGPAISGDPNVHVRLVGGVRQSPDAGVHRVAPGETKRVVMKRYEL